MSSSNGSLSSDPNAFILPSSNELSDIVLDHAMVDKLNETFETNNDVTGAAHLRHYGFLSESLRRLRHELKRHSDEQTELFDHMMQNDGFRGQIRPIVLAFRKEQRKELRRLARLQRSPTPFPPPSRSSSRSSKRSTKSDTIPSSTKDTPSGSAQNPIDVDDDFGTFNKYNPGPAYVRSESNRPRFHPVCERCGIIGHDIWDCDTPLRSFIYCSICDWKGKSQRDCNHIDLSPAAFKKLQGDIPYDHESD